MPKVYAKRLVALAEKVREPDPVDDLSEAGRKALLQDFMKMLRHEAGSCSGDDIEDVHQMRVAIRRMRSLLRALKPWYRQKTIKPFMADLRKTARVLGEVRDLDVLLVDLERYQSELPDNADADAVQALIEKLIALRQQARKVLIRWIDSKAYRQFIRAFSEFLSTPGQGVVALKSPEVPHQVRHLAPVMLHDCLARVRAYDVLMDDMSVEQFHALRIVFKEMRYMTAFFQPVLGVSAGEFIKVLKSMQDILGRLNDIHVARDVLTGLSDLDDVHQAMIAAYLSTLDAEAEAELVAFPDAWARFNNRSTQRKLSDSLLVLR